MKIKGWVVIMVMLAMPSILMAQGASETGTQVLSSPKGCFVVGQISFVREDQYMLDTCTGRLWKLIVDIDTKGKFLEPVVFQEMPRIKGASVLPPPIQQSGK